MNINPAEIESILKCLEATPHRLEALSEGIDKTQLHQRSDEGPWSPNDNLAHLRACADVWGKSIMAMILQKHPTLHYTSPRIWIRNTNYLEQDFHLSLEAFKKQRSELLVALKALTNTDWSRSATFTATTKGREQTVLSYAQRIAEHDNEHCAQIEVLLKDRR
jgi:hypothetical protein